MLAPVNHQRKNAIFVWFWFVPTTLKTIIIEVLQKMKHQSQKGKNIFQSETDLLRAGKREMEQVNVTEEPELDFFAFRISTWKKLFDHRIVVS